MEENELSNLLRVYTRDFGILENFIKYKNIAMFSEYSLRNLAKFLYYTIVYCCKSFELIISM